MKHFAVFLFSILILLSFAPQVEAQTKTKQQLEQELRDLEAQIQSVSQTITKTQQEGQTIARDISVLEAKIKASKLEIKKHETAVARLNQGIKEKDRTIVALNEKIEREKDSLAQILRKTDYLSQYTLMDFALQGDTLSNFFLDNDSFTTLKKALNQSFEDIRITKTDVETVKDQLEDDKQEEQLRKQETENQKKKVETNQLEKKTLLNVKKSQESAYKKMLSEHEAQAAKIRAALFELRDSNAIPFGTALEYANAASKATGVRPAFVLAILTQESSLGENVGSCYVSSAQNGNGSSIKSGKVFTNVIHPTRDIPPFLDLLKKLGRDPFQTRVSCPIAGIGWGGAMGPSQFIPSTWALYVNRLTRSTGSSVPDPWNPSHAIMATSMYLSDLGADSQQLIDEKNAACKYYSGKACSRLKAGNTYGTQVMARVSAIQANIDILQGR
jgi:membrane-bound lytic murein transglycosylase B